MKADALLSRLDKVRQRGAGRWIACCPAHDDKNPSMTVAEADDGRVLIHCFAGCEAGEIVAAVGLSFDALFPDKMASETLCTVGPMRLSAADALACVAWECEVMVIVLGDIRHGRPVTEENLKRVDVAIRRIRDAKELALGT